MEKISTFENGKEIWVLIDKGNDEFTSMPKSVYDEQQAAAKTNEAAPK